MSNIAKTVVGGLVVGLLALTAFAVNLQTRLEQPQEQPQTALRGQENSFPCEVHNGVQRCFNRTTLNQASTTVCAIRAPAATSTLVSGSVQLTTGTSTTISLEIGKSTLFDATTTRISYDASIVASAQETLTAFVASTTGVYGALGQQHTADEQDVVFAPNTYFVGKYGGAAGSLNVLVGSCQATFEVN